METPHLDIQWAGMNPEIACCEAKVLNAMPLCHHSLSKKTVGRSLCVTWVSFGFSSFFPLSKTCRQLDWQCQTAP